MGLYQKLQECTCIGDAQHYIPRKAKPALREMIETGVMFNNAPDQQTKALGQRFLAKAVQEMEDDEHKVKEDTAYQHQGGEHDVEKKTKEVMEEHPRDSEGSSSDADPLPMEGEEESNSAIESMQGMDQTQQFGGQGPIDTVQEQENPLHIAGVDSQTMREIAGGKIAKLPPLTTRQILRIINYNINEALRPYRRVIAKHQEAIIAYGKQMQETRIKSGSMKLDLDNLRKNATVKEYKIQETEVEGVPQADGSTMHFPKANFPKMKLQETRSDIMALDEQLTAEKSKSY